MRGREGQQKRKEEEQQQMFYQDCSLIDDIEMKKRHAL